MRTPTARRVVLLVLAALLIALHYARPLSPGVHSSAAPSAATSPTHQLRLGTLVLQRCEIGRRGFGGVGTLDAFCVAFDVPEDWDAPSGRHIQLRAAIVRSVAVHSDTDLVVFLDGGPGGAATEDYPEIAPAMEALLQRRDILLVDQRGTGGFQRPCLSRHRLCRPRVAGAHRIPGRGTDCSRCCSNALPRCAATRRPSTTPPPMPSAIWKRSGMALGAPQLDLLGISYGTRVAQQYAAHYPGAVRSVVLDSAVPNPLALLQRTRAQSGTGAARAVRAL